jgi:GMP synthase (glutamine-hydrolysing)
VTVKHSWVAIQHVPYEDPGLIAQCALRRGIELQLCHPYRGEPLPSWKEIDGLVVLGGPMGVQDTAEHPHLAREIELIATMVRTGRPVLGVCLGAQLLAHSLGANVYPGEQAEVGFGSVSLTPAGRNDPVLGSLGTETLPVVHWHQDTFDLPDDALWLARSALYPHQAFRVDECAYAFQFHVEVNRELADAWSELWPAETLDEPSVIELERAGRVALDAFFGLACR